MSGRGRTRSLAATAAAAAMCVGALAGCTGGDANEVVVDGDADPTAELAAAVERTAASSGRMVTTFEWDMTAMGDTFAELDDGGTEGSSDLDQAMPEKMAMHMEGEFSGDDLRATVQTTTDPPGQELFELDGDVLFVDGAVYSSMDPMSGMGEAVGTGLDPTSAIEQARGGRHWIEQAPMGEEADASFDATGLGFTGPESTTELLGSLSQVEQGPPVETDGVSLQSFRGVVAADMLSGDGESFETATDDEELSPEDRARQERIERYRDEHLRVDVEVLVDPEGLLRRVEMTYRDDVEEQYRDCIDLMSFGGGTITVEYSDLGAPIDIVAPDPADVMSAAEYDRAFEEWSSSALDELGAGEGADLGELTESVRPMLEESVRDGAASIGLDPATIPAMSEDELYGALDRIAAAEDAAPKVPTALGEMTRSELLWHVRAGMEREGVDPSLADGMTDQQLADLIDAYMADPELAEKIPAGYTVDDTFSTGMDGLDDDWMFEGCPE